MLEAPTEVGSYAVIVTAPGWRESLTGLFEIVPGSQSIDFAPPGQLFVDAAPLELEAIASSGLPVTLSLISGPATLQGNTLTLTGQPGTIELEAVQAGDGNWQSAQTISRQIQVIERVDEIYRDRFEVQP